MIGHLLEELLQQLTVGREISDRLLKVTPPEQIDAMKAIIAQYDGFEEHIKAACAINKKMVDDMHALTNI